MHPSSSQIDFVHNQPGGIVGCLGTTFWKIAWIFSVVFVNVISAWSIDNKASVRHTTSCWASSEEKVAQTTAAAVLTLVLVSQTETTNVERALKVALRTIPDGQVRKRVSQLVLGTFILQKRHEYIYNVTLKNTTSDMITSMVDLHAAYLDNITLDNVPWPLDPIERIAVYYSMPDFLVRAWVDEYGVEETEELCRVSNEVGPITLRRNAIRCSSDEILKERLCHEEGVQLSVVMEGCLRITSDRPKSIWAMSSWREGWFEVQDVGSQYIVAATEVGGNDKVVVDYCAGNGGKTLAILSQLHSQNSSATVWAHDVVDMRLAQLRGSLARAGVSTSAVQLFTTSNADKDLAHVMANVVLVDAPCSSCGVLRRRPSHRWKMMQHDLEDVFPRLQLDILRNASRLVKLGGRLVYSTCSICRAENEDVAAEWEKEVGDSWEPWPFDTPREGSHYCKFLPHKHDSDGFFIARWKRTSRE